jgi:hypothetical protein
MDNVEQKISNKMTCCCGTHWKIEEHVDNPLGTCWEHIANNTNPKTPLPPLAKENK